MQDLADNLRYLCAEYVSTAEICRRIEIHPMQFSKYINGHAKPSAHNLRRIALFFALDEKTLLLPHDEFRRYFASLSTPQLKKASHYEQGFPGNLRQLRRYLGGWHVFYRSPALPGKIVVAASFWHENDGRVYSRSLETLRLSQGDTRQRSRSFGLVSLHHDRLFINEFEPGSGGSFTNTILDVPHRHRKVHIFGVMSFLASFPSRLPCASRTVWKHLPHHMSAKEMLRYCGAYSQENTIIAPAIRRYLLEEQTDSLLRL